jgi:hypothetical protein
MMNKPKQNAWLWWLSIASLSIGISMFILIDPAQSEPQAIQLRSTALIASLLITGLCVIIGTRDHWFK